MELKFALLQTLTFAFTIFHQIILKTQKNTFHIFNIEQHIKFKFITITKRFKHTTCRINSPSFDLSSNF